MNSAVWNAVALIVLFAAGCSSEPARTNAHADAIAAFRAGERECIAAFNAALRRQKANDIDEHELAAEIERDVLVPWRALRQRVVIAPELTQYLIVRQAAWQAYAAALRAPDEVKARPLYDAYHAYHDESTELAHQLGGLFRLYDAKP